MSLRWPQVLWLVRHGESAGNVARDLADAAGIGRIQIDERDVDVPLSALGEAQACALGHWFAGMAEHERPQDDGGDERHQDDHREDVLHVRPARALCRAARRRST